jgi:purine-binding chemotaxis protein CheW
MVLSRNTMSESPALGMDGPFNDLSGSPSLLVFVVDGHRLAVDLAIVDRVVPMVVVAPLAGAPPAVLGAVDVAGVVVPVYDLRRRLGWPAGEYGADAALVLARTGRRPVAVAADEVIGVRDVGEAALAGPDRLPPGMQHAAGAVALDDGVAVINDLDAFLSPEEERLLAPALAEAEHGGG